MKLIGLLGGMSWESTAYYYKILNETVREMLGGLHSARCVIYSVDFDEIEKCQADGDWDKSAEILAEAAQSLERAGADCIAICTNTMHKVAPQIQDGISIPIIHIASETARVLKDSGIGKVGLLGTKYTMEQDFYKRVIMEAGIDVIVPEEGDRQIVNEVIFSELCLGKVRDESRQEYLRIIGDLESKGAQGVILGCTEICMLVDSEVTNVPLFDTTEIHAKRLAEISIGGK